MIFFRTTILVFICKILTQNGMHNFYYNLFTTMFQIFNRFYEWSVHTKIYDRSKRDKNEMTKTVIFLSTGSKRTFLVPKLTFENYID